MCIVALSLISYISKFGSLLIAVSVIVFIELIKLFCNWHDLIAVLECRYLGLKKEKKKTYTLCLCMTKIQ